MVILQKLTITKNFTVFLLFFVTLLYSKPEVFFAPDDNPVEQLIKQINETKKRFYGAIYMLTDQKVADALIAAAQRKVDVQLVIDQVSFGKFGKGDLLGGALAQVYVYVPMTTGAFDDIMHNKFALFDDKLTWCGSANWTNAANKKNQESVVLFDNKEIYLRFEKQFNVLKERSITYKEYCAQGRRITRSSQKSSTKRKRTLDELLEKEYLLRTIEAVTDFLRSLFW